MILTLKRTRLTPYETLGQLYVDQAFYCDTIEPPSQPNTIHPKGCILEGWYEINITHSPKFKRLLPLLRRVPNFEGIRMHAGNNCHHTAGCILVGEGEWRRGDDRKKRPTLLQSRKTETALVNQLLNAQKKHETIYIHITTVAPLHRSARLLSNSTSDEQ